MKADGQNVGADLGKLSGLFSSFLFHYLNHIEYIGLLDARIASGIVFGLSRINIKREI